MQDILFSLMNNLVLNVDLSFLLFLFEAQLLNILLLLLELKFFVRDPTLQGL